MESANGPGAVPRFCLLMVFKICFGVIGGNGARGFLVWRVSC